MANGSLNNLLRGQEETVSLCVDCRSSEKKVLLSALYTSALLILFIPSIITFIIKDKFTFANKKSLQYSASLSWNKQSLQPKHGYNHLPPKKPRKKCSTAPVQLDHLTDEGNESQRVMCLPSEQIFFLFGLGGSCLPTWSTTKSIRTNLPAGILPEVSREMRYEIAKMDSGEWVSLSGWGTISHRELLLPMTCR